MKKILMMIGLGSVENVINGPNEQLNVKNEEVEQKSSEKEIVQEEGIVDSKNQRNINRDRVLNKLYSRAYP